MATPGELVKLIAAATGDDVATVVQHDRNLAIAGLRTMGGRGRSAAKVTARDAAHVLTSVLGSHRVKDAVDTVRRYLQTQEHHAHWHQHYPDKLQGMGKANVWEDYGIPELAALPREHSFIDALTALITLAAEGRLIRELDDFHPLDGIKIIVTSPRTHARISMRCFRNRDDYKSVQADYGSNEPPPEWIKDLKKPPPDDVLARRSWDNPKLDRWTEMNALPILYIGALLAGKLGEMPPLKSISQEASEEQRIDAV
jgi:hypothetical protein